MFNLGDIYRNVVNRLDEVFIQLFGKRMLHYSCISGPSSVDYSEPRRIEFNMTPTELRAYYDIPVNLNNQFGIDTPDLMVVHLAFNDTISKLKKFPGIGDILVDNLMRKWQITTRDHIDNGRLTLTVTRFQESVVPGYVPVFKV